MLIAGTDYQSDDSASALAPHLPAVVALWDLFEIDLMYEECKAPKGLPNCMLFLRLAARLKTVI
jgi:hypothetical protein